MVFIMRRAAAHSGLMYIVQGTGMVLHWRLDPSFSTAPSSPNVWKQPEEMKKAKMDVAVLYIHILPRLIKLATIFKYYFDKTCFAFA